MRSRKVADENGSFLDFAYKQNLSCCAFGGLQGGKEVHETI